MLIKDATVATVDGLLQVNTRLVSEDSARDDFPLFFQTPEASFGGRPPNTQSLVLAGLLHAFRGGERRVLFEGPLCPILRDNLRTACLLLKSWFPNDFGEPPTIESRGRSELVEPPRSGAVSLISCGVDSLALLRWNRLNLPAHHCAAINAVMPAVFAGEPAGGSAEFASEAAENLAAAVAVAEDAGVELIPVRTNLYSLYSGYFWDYKGHGAALAAMATLASTRFGIGYIASVHPVWQLSPWGSHPLLDACYSSGDFAILHWPKHMRRLDKVALVADWECGRDHLRVCQKSEIRNCGRCEKCTRTMLELLAVGKLHECRAFPVDDLAPEAVDRLLNRNLLKHWSDASWYQELLPDLEHRGRFDLSAAVRRLLSEYAERYPHWQRLRPDAASLL